MARKPATKRPQNGERAITPPTLEGQYAEIIHDAERVQGRSDGS